MVPAPFFLPIAPSAPYPHLLICCSCVLQDASAQADIELAQLKRTTGDLAKTAKAAQVELRKQQKTDEVEAAERAAVIEAELLAKLEEQRVAKEKRAAAVALKRAAEEAERKAFEAKVIARREQTSAAMKIKKGVDKEVDAAKSS